jgi:SlyX protein
MESRLNELEIKISFTEDLVETLNLTVYRQQQAIELLQQEIRALRQQLVSSMPAETRNLLDEIPPHY